MPRSLNALALLLPLLVAAFPCAAATDPDCLPAEDHTVTAIPLPTATYYVKTKDLVVRAGVEVPVPVLVWEETNEIDGLQPNAEMACGAKPDAGRLDANGLW